MAFSIAMATGCRLQEVSIDFRNIDFELKFLHLHTKGGKHHTMPVPPSIERLLVDAKVTGAKKTCTLPPMPSKHWWRFFRQIGLPHLSFHSTRVTVASRLCRAGIQERVAMRFLGHASATVHRIYKRMKVEDLNCCLRALEGTKG